MLFRSFCFGFSQTQMDCFTAKTLNGNGIVLNYREMCIRDRVIPRLNRQDADTIRKLAGEANNINQLAHRANAGGFALVDVYKRQGHVHCRPRSLQYSQSLPGGTAGRHGVSSVSYTHLDVYKRQVSATSSVSAARRISTCRRRLTVNSLPTTVSCSPTP